MFQGNICWIWEHLASKAVQEGADLFVLLGDDVHMLSNTWQAAVEQAFTDVSQVWALCNALLVPTVLP